MTPDDEVVLNCLSLDDLSPVEAWSALPPEPAVAPERQAPAPRINGRARGCGGRAGPGAPVCCDPRAREAELLSEHDALEFELGEIQFDERDR